MSARQACTRLSAWYLRVIQHGRLVDEGEPLELAGRPGICRDVLSSGERQPAASADRGRVMDCSVAPPQIFAHNKFCSYLAVRFAYGDYAIARCTRLPVDTNSVFTTAVARHKKHAQARTVAIVIREAPVDLIDEFLRTYDWLFHDAPPSELPHPNTLD